MLDTIEDLEAFLAPYSEREDQVNAGTLTYDQYCDYVNETVTMPPFHTFEEDDPLYYVETDSTTLALKDSVTGEVLKTDVASGEKVIEYYDYIQTELKGDIRFVGDFETINDGVYTIKHMGSSNHSLTVHKEGERTSRMLIAHTSADSKALAKNGYIGFLSTALEYMKNPNDFLLSWEFINSHPAFWYRWNEKFEHAWNTDNGVSKMWVQPTLNDDGELVFMMETGAAVPPARTTHYHDLRLDVWAPTYENGIIQTAALVHKFFHLDGSEREDVEYQKSELELILEQRINELSQDES